VLLLAPQHPRRSSLINPYLNTAGLSLAALFAQPLVLAIPVVVLWKVGTDLRKLGTIAVAGIVVVVLSYGSLALV
jgi:hypothetical protein